MVEGVVVVRGVKELVAGKVKVVGVAAVVEARADLSVRGTVSRSVCERDGEQICL